MITRFAALQQQRVVLRIVSVETDCCIAVPEPKRFVFVRGLRVRPLNFEHNWRSIGTRSRKNDGDEGLPVGRLQAQCPFHRTTGDTRRKFAQPFAAGVGRLKPI